MRTTANIFAKMNKVSLATMSIGPAFWILDAMVKAYLLGEGTFFYQLISPTPIELWMRLFVMILMLAFGFVFLEHSEVERNLRQSEQDKSLILDNMSELVAYQDAGNKLIWVNKAVSRAFNMPPNQLIGKVCFEVFHQRKEPCESCPVVKAVKSGKEESSEMASSDGRAWRINATPIKDEIGNVKGILEVTLNITKRKRIEESLSESETRFKELFDNMKNCVAVYEAVDEGRDFVFKNLNKAAETIEQITRDKVIGRKVTEVFPDVKRFGLLDVFRKVFQTGTPLFHPVSFYKDERVTGWRENYVYKLESGEIVAIYEDVTERKKAEEELKTAYEQIKATQAKLIQSSKMAAVGQLASGVAHEINNPLTGVLNNVQLLKMEMDMKQDVRISEFREVLGVVEDAALRCKDIIQSLLGFSHASSGMAQLVSMNEAIEKVISLINNEMKLQNIRFILQLQAGLPKVMGDLQLFQQVVFNLFSNARWAIEKKSGKAGGTISVTTQYDSVRNLILVSIADTGIGIAQENFERIFEPFFTTKDIGEGTGLGLAFVYNIIKEHKGMVEVESKEQEGTTFKIYLPAAEESKAVEKEKII